MLEKLKRFLGTTKVDNRAGVSSKTLELLTRDFSRLDKLESGLSNRVLHFVVDGEGEEILLELAGKKGCGKAIGLGCCLTYTEMQDKPRQFRKQLFSKVEEDKPEVYARLAQVYDAVSRCDLNKLFIETPGVDEWVEIFLLEVMHHTPYGYYRDENVYAFSAETIEKILELGGTTPDMLYRIVFLAEAESYPANLARELTHLNGFMERIALHPQPVMEALNHKNARQRNYALGIMTREGSNIEPFREKIVELAVSSAKTVRQATHSIIFPNKDRFIELLKKVMVEGTNPQRLQAVTLYWKMMGKQGEVLLRERLKKDTSKKVKEALEGFLIEPVPCETGEAPTFDLPAIAEVHPVASLPKETLTALKEFAEQYNRDMHKLKEQRKGDKYFKPYIIPSDTVKKAYIFLQEGKFKSRHLKVWGFNMYYGGEQLNQMIKAFLERPELELVHAVRFLIYLNYLHYNYKDNHLNITGPFEQYLRHYCRSHKKVINLRHIAAVLKSMDVDTDMLGWTCIHGWGAHIRFMWESDSVWPYYAENIHILEEIFRLRPQQKDRDEYYSYYYNDIRHKAFIIMSQFPHIPANFQAPLWEIALGTAKSERKTAQACISKLPGQELRIIEGLKSGRQDERAVAALWLEELKYKEAIPHLKAALKKEKSDSAKGAMMEALEAMGVPVEEFLKRSSLVKEAAASLKKGIPKQLTWFPFDALPTVHWQDNGKVVHKDIIKWLLVMSFKLKSPEPGPVLRKYCSFMKRDDKAALAKVVLNAWITQDTIPRYTYEEAVPVAQQQAQQFAKWVKDSKPEDYYQGILNGLLHECKGSAAKEKGLLAVAAICCDADAVPTVDSYLKKYFGNRASQSKSLVQMLSWVEHPMAIQQLLSVANRFRTKSIQEEANKYVKILAERKGWTIDELADRTIPTAGFDESGKMELDYGSRSFTCRLGDDFKVSVVNESGKALKTLPNAAKADDPDLVKAAKKDFSAAKKMVKSVLKLQKERLYESMCVQREWNFEDLRNFLFNHPIVAHYCRSLIWVAMEEGKPAQYFRPLDDGSLTDYEDNEISLEETAKVHLAHSCNTETSIAKAWDTHFTDYELESLFVQFRAEMFALKPEDKENTSIIEFKGYMLDNFKLRGTLVKLGYSRGQAEDGGFFYEYLKSFPGQEIEAVIEFSGSSLPEENTRIALLSLSFRETVKKSDKEESYEYGYGYGSNALTLGEVPAVLLSETWNDFKQVATSGSGYEKEWEKQ
ncbi:MAG: DUF4132 domain-containing protein [bacterium]|nr:DUF4132 domain-containing protein [bacterium]